MAVYNNQLSRGGQADAAQLSEALIALRRLAHTGFRIVLISDFATQTGRWKDAIQALARRNQLTVVQIYDPLELALPEADLYTVTDGRTRLRLNTGERRLREHGSDAIGDDLTMDWHYRCSAAEAFELLATREILAHADPNNTEVPIVLRPRPEETLEPSVRPVAPYQPHRTAPNQPRPRRLAVSHGPRQRARSGHLAG